MRLIVAGGTGFLGQPLCERLAGAGHEVVVLSRRPPTDADAAQAGWIGRPGIRTLRWTAEASTSGWAACVDGADAIVNLAGESIADKRWSEEQKVRLERSRVDTTRALVSAIRAAPRPPRLLVSGSAIGYYGSRGDEILTEVSAPGDDFLARLSVKWEAEALRARETGTRVALLRTGIVLASDGGALAKMLTPFRLGVGGPLGTGNQYMSWIHREDWLALVEWIVADERAGPFNLTAPTPETNAAFARALGVALGRPAIMRAPAFALRLAMGEMADALLLSSQRVMPERATAAGFTFTYQTLASALEGIGETGGQVFTFSVLGQIPQNAKSKDLTPRFPRFPTVFTRCDTASSARTRCAAGPPPPSGAR